MKAAIVPSANSEWEVEEINVPEPGQNLVLIKIRASGMCYTDAHQTRGELPGDFPRTLGHEPVGEIVTTAEPINPVAPVTKTRMLTSFHPETRTQCRERRPLFDLGPLPGVP